MVIECGHNFCKHCIEEWQKKFIEENPYEEPYPCPECRAVFKTVSPNISVKNFINDLTAVILDKEQKKDREETIKERLEKKKNQPIPRANNDTIPIINLELDGEDIGNRVFDGITMPDLSADSVAILLERLSNQDQSISDTQIPGAGTNDDTIIEAASILLPFITTVYGDDIGHVTLETLQQLANTYGLTMPGSSAAIVAALNEGLSELESLFDPPTPGAGANDDIDNEVITDNDNPEGDITGEVRTASNAALASNYYHRPIPTYHDDFTYGDIVNGDIVDDDTVDGGTSEDDTTDNEGTMQVTQELLLDTVDTIQDIFANQRSLPQRLITSNTRELAATPAPAEVEQPGTGVGAIPGEEPNRCVGFGCEYMGCPCQYLEGLMCLICDLEFNSLVTSIDHVKKEHLQELHQQESTGDGPHSDSTVELDVNDMELDRNSPGPDYTLSLNGRVMERSRNLPRPSPYSLEDHPRRSSNRRDLGR